MRVKSLRIRFPGGIVSVAPTPSSLATSGEPPSRKTIQTGFRSVRNGCENRISSRRGGKSINRKG